MDIAAVDRSATQGDSWLHRAAPGAKLAAFGLLLAAAVVSWNFVLLASLALLIAAAAVSARLNLKLTFGLAAYPALFAAVFAFASAPSAGTGLVIVLKAVTAALAAVTLTLTTPYPQVFAPVQKVVPGLVGDALLMTYRSFFLLLQRFSDLLTTVKLRSATRSGGLKRTVRDTSAALGNVVLYSFDLAQRDYDVMRVRGYSGRLRIAPRRRRIGATEIALVAVAFAAATACLLWRLRFEQLNPYSWLALIPALAALAAAALVRRRTA